MKLLSSLGVRNKGHGLEKNGCGFEISLNRFSNNAGFGILDTSPKDPSCEPNRYERNICSGNELGDSSPPGLCF